MPTTAIGVRAPRASQAGDPGASIAGPWTTIQQFQNPSSLNGDRQDIEEGADRPSADVATRDNLTTG